MDVELSRGEICVANLKAPSANGASLDRFFMANWIFDDFESILLQKLFKWFIVFLIILRLKYVLKSTVVIYGRVDAWDVLNVIQMYVGLRIKRGCF